VVGAIEPGMMRSETQRARRKTTERMDAWDHAFRGQWHFHHVTREHHREARACFRRAIEADPGLAEGHIWLCAA
jgi:adenylate cyclase